MLYKEPLGYIEGEELKRKETIVHCYHSLHILESSSLCPLDHFVFFPIFPLSCELAIERWRIEVVEAQVEDSFSLVRRRADRGCHYCSLILLMEISFHVQLCINEDEY